MERVKGLNGEESSESRIYDAVLCVRLRKVKKLSVCVCVLCQAFAAGYFSQAQRWLALEASQCTALHSLGTRSLAMDFFFLCCLHCL